MDANRIRKLCGMPLVESEQLGEAAKVDKNKIANVEKQIKDAVKTNPNLFKGGKNVAVITHTPELNSYGFHIEPAGKVKIGDVIKRKYDPDAVVVKLVSE